MCLPFSVRHVCCDRRRSITTRIIFGKALEAVEGTVDLTRILARTFLRERWFVAIDPVTLADALVCERWQLGRVRALSIRAREELTL